MQPFTSHTGIAAPLLKDDMNTDQIAPVRHSRSLKEDYKTTLFYRARRRDDGSEDPDFVLNKPQFRNAGILVTGHNFGAGSSRESAVWSMIANEMRGASAVISNNPTAAPATSDIRIAASWSDESPEQVGRAASQASLTRSTATFSAISSYAALKSATPMPRSITGSAGRMPSA